MSELPSSSTPADADPAPVAPAAASVVTEAVPTPAAAPEAAPVVEAAATGEPAVEAAAEPAVEAAVEAAVVQTDASSASADVAAPNAAGAAEDAGPQLKALFPALFSNPPKPLKLRIQADIQARAPGKFTKPQLSAFLRRYTGSHGYLNAIVKATHRFDLDGNPGDALSDEHRQAAVEELARRRTNANAKRDLELQQRANRATLLKEFGENTLPAAEFAASKGIPEAELEPLLDRARKEALEPPPAPERDRRGPPRHGPRRDAGAPRGDRPPREARAGQPAPEGQPPQGPRPPRPLRPDRGPHPDRGPRPEGQAHADGARPPRPQGQDARGPRPDHGAPRRADAPRGDRPRTDRPRDDRPRDDRPRAPRPDDRGPRPAPRNDALGPSAMANALAAVRDALKKK